MPDYGLAGNVGMDPFVEAVRRTMAALDMVERGGHVLVAVSGGPDSVALLAALWALARPIGLVVRAAHLNHGLRGAESDGDERLVRGVAERLGAPLKVERLSPGAIEGRRGGLEQAARRVRYDFLHRVAREWGCRRIATGHTRDDQAETVLLRLLRGSDKPGLSGVQAVRSDGVIRPLIRLGREDVLGYLGREGLPSALDSSNADPRFTRNRVRGELLPLLRTYNPRVVEHLAALAESLSGSAEAEAALARELVRAHSLPDGGLRVDAAGTMPAAARRLLVREWLREARGTLRRVAANHLEAVANLTGGGQAVCMPGGGRVVNEHGVLRYDRESQARQEAAAPAVLLPGGEVVLGTRWRIGASEVTPWAGGGLPQTPWDAVVDADAVTDRMVVRPWIAGDRVQPLGMDGHRKLSDIFIDKKIARRLRASYPVVEAAGEILWVPGLVRGRAALVTSATRQVVRLSVARPRA